MSARVIRQESSPTLHALQELASASGGALSPRAVVEAARDPDSPLHSEFEWDDSTAAEGFRLVQAGALIRRVRIKLIVEDEKTKTVSFQVSRAFESVPKLRGKDSGSYVAIEQIADQPDLRNDVVADVLRQLKMLRKKHEKLEALAGVWEEVDRLSA
jgi:hypothetical protein